MTTILQEGSKYMLRFDKGEEVLGLFKEFCVQKGIRAGTFFAIGAAKEVELAWYDVDEKKYYKETFQQKLEIASLLGNIALLKGEILIHNHGVFSDKQMHTIGGHINRMVVGATCELFLEVLEGSIEREYSEEIGLNLFKDAEKDL